MPIRSFTAIYSSSPPAMRQRRSHGRRRSCGATLAFRYPKPFPPCTPSGITFRSALPPRASHQWSALRSVTSDCASAPSEGVNESAGRRNRLPHPEPPSAVLKCRNSRGRQCCLPFGVFDRFFHTFSRSRVGCRFGGLETGLPAPERAPYGHG